VSRHTCNGGDIRNVTSANDKRLGRSYSRPMKARRRERKMKRTAVVLHVAAAFGVFTAVAEAGTSNTLVAPQVESQVVRSQDVRSQVVRQVVRPGVVRSAVVRQGLVTQRLSSLRRADVLRPLR
jgi:hypothetical protein